MGLFRKKHKKLAVLLTCADWRLHQRRVDINARLARRLGVDGIDTIAVPGPDGLVLPERCAEWASALAQIKLLIKAHAPVAIVVAAHQRCAGHPVSDGQHDADVGETAKELKEATGFTGPVHAMVLIYHSDVAWDVKPVAQY
jgi:hypothetical protein